MSIVISAQHVDNYSKGLIRVRKKKNTFQILLGNIILVQSYLDYSGSNIFIIRVIIFPHLQTYSFPEIYGDFSLF